MGLLRDGRRRPVLRQRQPRRAIVPRLVFDCLTATKGRSSSEEDASLESDDSTTRWRPFFFFLFESFFFGFGLRFPKLVQPLDHVLNAVLGLLRDDVRGHVPEDLLDLVLRGYVSHFLLLVRDVAVRWPSWARRGGGGVRRRGGRRRRRRGVDGVAGPGLPKLAGPLRGRWRAAHGTGTGEKCGWDLCATPATDLAPLRAADAFWPRAPKLQRRCQMDDERKS